MEEQLRDDKTKLSSQAEIQETPAKIQAKQDKKPSRLRWFLYGAGTVLALDIVLVLLFALTLSLEKVSNVTSPSPKVGPSELPEFPWPPPRASAEAVIPREFLRRPEQSVIRLGDVNHILVGALDANGYYDKSYYAVPDGFALVTRLEQINPDGTPKPLPSRWELEMEPLTRFSLSAYLRTLLTANPGYYRIIVFVVTSHPFSQREALVSQDQAMSWLHEGFERLPFRVSELEFTPTHGCTALVYEFKLASRDLGPTLELPSHLPGRTHLEKANIWFALSR